MMRYWPVPSVTAVRVFSIKTGLAASTTTPGSTAPDGSRTVPVSVACAKSGAGRSRNPRKARLFLTVRMGVTLQNVPTRRKNCDRRPENSTRSTRVKASEAPVIRGGCESDATFKIPSRGDRKACALRAIAGTCASEALVSPCDEVLPVGAVGMAAVVLAPGKLAVEQPDVHARHLLDGVVVRPSEIPRAEQPEHGACGDRRHV